MQKQSPLISIIIPTYNREHIISETLDSIARQSYMNWECIIIDDGSTDNTENLISGYTLMDQRFQYYKRPAHKSKGPNSCRNYGFELSKGECVNWFDSDDLYLPKALDQVVASYNTDVDVVVVKVERFDTETGNTIDTNQLHSKHLIEDYLKGHVTFYVCGPFWKRSFLEKQTALFDEHIRNLDDWDFNLRMLYQEPIIIYIDEALIRYRKFHLSLSKALVNHNAEEITSAFYAREKHVALLKYRKSNALKPFNNFIISQYKKHLKALLYANKRFSKTILKRLVLKQLSLLKIGDAFKTIGIGLFYLVFKKGHFLLKKL